MPFEPGSRLGRIRIDALLGVGGMGSVYRGFDERLERAVAVKEIHAAAQSSSAVRTRFLREARALSQLDHPNICRIYDVLERVDGDYLILELIEGETLRERMTRGLARDEALRIALQVARVLVAAHGRGIVHRDLKPDNVMLTAAGEVKVLDFGLARFAGDLPSPVLDEADFVADDIEKTAVLGRVQATTAPDASRTSAGTLIGTVTYMSPEQARGLPIDGASDVYSLGIVLYELLTGHRAYAETESFSDLLVRVRGAAIDWRDFGRHDLDTLLRQLTALHPADRPTAEEAATAIETALARPSRIRRRWIAAASAALAVALIVGGITGVRSFAESRAVLAANRGHRIAVLPFRNATGDPSLRWVESGLSELVSGGLSTVHGAAVVAPEDTLRTMRGLRLPPAAALTDQQRGRLLAALGADALIESSVVSDERGRYTIRFAPWAPDRAESPRQVSSSVLTDAANQMVRQLALRLDPASVPAGLRTRYSADPFANTAYAIGQQEDLARGPKTSSKYYAVAADRDPDFAAAKLALAEARNKMAEHAEADRLVSEVLEQARRRGDAWMRAEALLRLGRSHNLRSQYAAGEREGNEALRIGAALRDPKLMMDARNVVGESLWRTSRLEQAEQTFRAALATAVSLRDLHAQARALNNLAVVLDAGKHAAEAERMYGEALKMADRVNDRELSSRVLGNFTSIYVESGRAALAEPLVKRQIVIARETGDATSEILGYFNLAILLYSRGAEEEAIATMEHAAAASARADRPRFEILAQGSLATARTKRGDLAGAQRNDAAALALLPRVAGDREAISEVWMGHAYWLTRMGRTAEAESLLSRVERDWRVNARSLRMHARVAYERGDYRGAAGTVLRARALGEQWLHQDEQMREAFLESAKTGKPSSIPFEQPVRHP
jgi:tetratricopeptide (TPR) repeat protein